MRIDIDDLVAKDRDSAFLDKIRAALRGKEHSCKSRTAGRARRMNRDQAPFIRIVTIFGMESKRSIGLGL